MKSLITKVVSILLILLIFAGNNTAVALRDKDEQIAKMEADLAVMEMNSEEGQGGGFKDGTYEGSAKGYGGTVTMEVVIENGRINQINPVSHPGEDAVYWKMAMAVIPQLVDSQGAKADTISGATFSSAGIINGTIEALSDAL